MTHCPASKFPQARLQTIWSATGPGANGVARWCLVAAIAAIGVRTRLQDIVKVGIKPVLLMVAETMFLAVLVMAALLWHGAHNS